MNSFNDSKGIGGAIYLDNSTNGLPGLNFTNNFQPLTNSQNRRNSTYSLEAAFRISIYLLIPN